MIRIENLRKRFKTRTGTVEAVRGVGFEAHDGQDFLGLRCRDLGVLGDAGDFERRPQHLSGGRHRRGVRRHWGGRRRRAVVDRELVAARHGCRMRHDWSSIGAVCERRPRRSRQRRRIVLLSAALE